MKKIEKWKKILAVLLCTIVVASVATLVYAHNGDGNNARTQKAHDDDDDDHDGFIAFGARLNGFQEVPAKISNGTGTFKAVLSDDGTSINYTLTYSGLGSQAHFAHIHVGQAGVNGAVIVFLCGGGGKPDCPASGSVSGTLTKSDVMAIADQGVTAGNFNALLTAIQHGVAYVNVHTTNFPSGEIRGQIITRHENHEDKEDDD